MMITQQLLERTSACELCNSSNDLNAFAVAPKSLDDSDHCALLCADCAEQIEHPDKINTNHWHCLRESMWSAYAPVQVLAWRMLQQLSAEPWAQDLQDMLVLDANTQSWAEALDAASDAPRHIDSNGQVLAAGDTVVLIKDLDVKGAGFTAKRGTAVRGISLVANNEKHIEGRVNGQRIVILTEFVKKS